MIVGAGPIVIGQACEFDYSGTQACKALKSAGYKVILLNSNPATIMTDPGTADRTYIGPMTPDLVEQVRSRNTPAALRAASSSESACSCSTVTDMNSAQGGLISCTCFADSCKRETRRHSTHHGWPDWPEHRQDPLRERHPRQAWR